MTEPVRIPWRPIEPLAQAHERTNGAIAAVDALRQEWERRLSDFTATEQARIRQRSLRRLSVETGILERLYDLDWGLTLTLVAEGFTRDVVERAGGVVDDRTLATLRAQLDSLGMVLDFVQQQRELSSSLIKELHQAITRTQQTYVATDSLGRLVEAPLPKGEWKLEPNHVLRHDNTLLEYAPPEQVGSEIDRLVSLWQEIETRGVHPLVKAAWLHHRFVQIHPFADGNGRVARALTLLVVEKEHFAPLVVDRWHREPYLRALDEANVGDLSLLVSLFVKLEGAALTSELERPIDREPPGLAVDVAHTLAAQLAEARRRRQGVVVQSLLPRAVVVRDWLVRWFDRKKSQLGEVFRDQDLDDVRVVFDNELRSERRHWFRWQITESAHAANHYADFNEHSGFCGLRVKLDHWQMRFVASLHGIGREPGVMGVTTFAEVEPTLRSDSGEEPSTARNYVRTTTDAFRFVHSEGVEQLREREAELEELLEQGLAVALADLMARA